MTNQTRNHAKAFPEITIAVVGGYRFVRQLDECGAIGYTVEPCDNDLDAEDTYSAFYCEAGRTRFTSYLNGKRHTSTITR